MPFLSSFAQRKKIDYFLRPICKNAKILEIGCADQWVGRYLKENGWTDYTGIDLVPPADYVGSIKDWKSFGLKAESFDVIVAFEIMEHVDCFQECYDLLKNNGKLLITTPVPSMDPILEILEYLGLNQKRTSPHQFLVDSKQVQNFPKKQIRTVAYLSQWAIFEKQNNP